MGRKRLITVKFTEEEADALLNAGDRGIADLHDAQGDDDFRQADLADAALKKVGQAFAEAWPDETKVQ